jgi:hypothetical protein
VSQDALNAAIAHPAARSLAQMTIGSDFAHF